MRAAQLEAAARKQLQLFHNRDEAGDQPDFSGLQVLLHSSRRFGPDSIRELSVCGQNTD